MEEEFVSSNGIFLIVASFSRKNKNDNVKLYSMVQTSFERIVNEIQDDADDR